MTWCSPRLTSSPKSVIFKHLYEHFSEQLSRHRKRFSITRSSTFPTKNDVGISRVCFLGPPPKQQEHVWSVSVQSNSYMEIIITLIKLIRSFQNNKVIRLTIKVIVNMHNHLPSSCKKLTNVTHIHALGSCMTHLWGQNLFPYIYFYLCCSI